MADWLALGICWRIPALLNGCVHVVAQKVIHCAPRTPWVILKPDGQNGCFDLGNKVCSVKLGVIKEIVFHPAPSRPITKNRSGNRLSIHPARCARCEIRNRHADNVHARPDPFIIKKMHCTGHGCDHTIAGELARASRHPQRLSTEGLAYANHFMSRCYSL